MDASNAQKMIDLFGGDSGGAPGAPSRGDFDKKLLSTMSDIKPPSPPDYSAETKAAKEGLAQEAGMAKSIQDAIKVPPPERPKLMDVQKPIEQQFSSPFDAFKSIIPVFTIFASLATRHPLQTAMTSMAASMDAFHKGEIEKFAQERDNYKENTEYALHYNQQALDSYKAILDSRHLDLSEKQVALETQMTVNKDQMGLVALKKDGIDGAYKYFDESMSRMEKMSTVHKNMMTEMDKMGGLTPEKYQQYQSDPAMKVALKAYKITGDARGALGGGIFGGKDMGQKVEALQRMAYEDDPNFNPAISKLTMQGHQKELNTVELSAGKISLASNILSTSLPSLQQAAAKLNLSDVKGINNIYNAARSQLNDADFKNFSTQMRAVATDYGQFIGRTTGTVHSDEEAMRILNEGMSDKSLQGFADAVETERGNVQSGVDKTLADIVKASSGGASPAAPVDLHEKYGLEK